MGALIEMCTVSRLVRGWAGQGVVPPGLTRGPPLPRISEGAGGSPGPPVLPCRLHPWDTGPACREQLLPCTVQTKPNQTSITFLHSILGGKMAREALSR